MRETFTANVKYNDFKGSVAADVHDSTTLSSWLKDEGLLKANEHLVGISVYSGDYYVGDLNETTIGLNAYVTDTEMVYEDLRAVLRDQPDETLLRKIELDISPAQFFAWFKRFEITMSRDGIMNGVPLAYHEEPQD